MANARLKRRDFTWAAGSYVQFFTGAAVMQVLYAIFAVYMFFFSSTDSEATDIEVRASFIFCAILGWMSIISAGMAFDLFPLTHKIAPFDNTLMKVFLLSNCTGQFLILVGIATGDSLLIDNLGMIGFTLIAVSFFSMAPPLRATFRSRDLENANSLWSLFAGFFFPFIALQIIITWVFRDDFLVQGLALAIIVDALVMTMAFSVLMGHLNGRLGWEIRTPQELSRGFIVFAVLLAIHVSGMVLDHTRQPWFEPWMQLTWVLPVIWMVHLLRPVQLWRMRYMQKRTCSPHVFTAVNWMLISIPIAVYEATQTNSGMEMARSILVFGVFLQCIWGVAQWLHDDHKHISIEERSSGKVNLYALQMGLGLVIIHELFFHDMFHDYASLMVLTAALMFIIAYVSWFAWWLFGSYLSLDEWHRLPMNYMEYELIPDDALPEK